MSTTRPASPASLLTATPAEGQRLARQLAEGLLAALPADDQDMPAMLQTPAQRPSPEVATAIYFHVIALANAGWADAPPPARSPG